MVPYSSGAGGVLESGVTSLRQYPVESSSDGEALAAEAVSVFSSAIAVLDPNDTHAYQVTANGYRERVLTTLRERYVTLGAPQDFQHYVTRLVEAGLERTMRRWQDLISNAQVIGSLGSRVEGETRRADAAQSELNQLRAAHVSLQQAHLSWILFAPSPLPWPCTSAAFAATF